TWYPGDAEAITWLNEHVSGIPVITEASQLYIYERVSRISMYTGLPTILGWYSYEGIQWRDNLPLILQRNNDVNALYGENNPDTVMRIVREYHVQYIYVGQLECLEYGLSVPGQNPDFPSLQSVDDCASQHSLVGSLTVFS